MAMLLMLSAGSGAKDLGTWGNVFEPAEQDMLAFIQNRLKGMEQSGELDRLRREATDRVKEHAVRPTPVAGLTKAEEYRSFAWDPTFIVKETITDMQGNVIARKGDTVNPLDKVPFSQVLYFIDGDDKGQMNWIRQQIAGQTNVKVILVKGNIKETSDALNERIFFDQSGVLTRKFGFEHIPARISRDGRVMKVEEIPVSGAKKMSATTLGDLFPHMHEAVTTHRRYAKQPRKASAVTSRMGTAERLKTLYPELDSWHPVLVTKAWLHWCGQNRQETREPEKRDERFPDYIVHLLLETMRAEDNAKRKKGQTLSLSERLDRLFSGDEQENVECH